jgi:ribosome-associated protein
LSPGLVGPREQVTERKGPLTTSALSRAGARAQPAPVSKPRLDKPRPDAEETLRIILASLDDMKAEDIVSINLQGKTSIGDFMVVASGRSNRHVGAVADAVVKELGEAGARGVRVEGMAHCDWVLIDAGDVIVHVFRPEVRSFYAIEKMWAPGRTGAKRAS